MGVEYHGTRTDDGGYAVTVVEDGRPRALDPRFDLRVHSPAGFSWAYAGAGPAQLALALAADALGDDDRARDVYMKLKFDLVAALPADGWVLDRSRVLAAIDQIEAARGRSRGGFER